MPPGRGEFYKKQRADIVEALIGGAFSTAVDGGADPLAAARTCVEEMGLLDVLERRND